MLIDDVLTLVSPFIPDYSATNDNSKHKIFIIAALELLKTWGDDLFAIDETDGSIIIARTITASEIMFIAKYIEFLPLMSGISSESIGGMSQSFVSGFDPFDELRKLAAKTIPQCYGLNQIKFNSLAGSRYKRCSSSISPIGKIISTSYLKM